MKDTNILHIYHKDDGVQVDCPDVNEAVMQIAGGILEGLEKNDTAALEFLEKVVFTTLALEDTGTLQDAFISSLKGHLAEMRKILKEQKKNKFAGNINVN